MKSLISTSCISLLAISVTACASGSGPTPASSTQALSMDECKAHVSQFVPNQNKSDAAIRKDLACANMVKKS